MAVMDTFSVTAIFLLIFLIILSIIYSEYRVCI